VVREESISLQIEDRLSLDRPCDSLLLFGAGGGGPSGRLTPTINNFLKLFPFIEV